ncbi:MAG: Crp/Fnr family transcriptional regulator [Anaerolineales bacterium]|nr:Crp/Fnr family transcriptional regulator [Anaerolineales bacterium]
MTNVIISIAERLRGSPLFQDVEDRDLRSVAGQCTLTAYDRESEIFQQGDPCTHVFIVDRGQVKIVFQDEDGREVIIELIDAGQAFGGGVLHFPAQPATARAMEPSTVISLPREHYNDFLRIHPGITLRLLKMLGQRHYTMLQGQALVGTRVERRMAFVLLKIAGKCGEPIDDGTRITLALSRQDLANFSGTTLETAIRTISRFTHERLVRTEPGGHLVLLNEKRLRELAQSG